MTTIDDLAQRIENLETRLRGLEDVKEIIELQQRYLRDLSDRNWSGIAEAYADEAVCDIRQHGRHVGRDEILSMFSAELQPVVTSKDAYMLSSPDVKVSGDEAYGEFVWHRFVCEFRTSFGMMRVWGPWSEGIYKVHYRRIDGAWKIVDLWTRVIRPDHDDDVAELAGNSVIGGGYVTSQTR